ncbi:MAG: right-handed parallel beta-helix repeat-containing protein [Bacteroidota bacterium]
MRAPASYVVLASILLAAPALAQVPGGTYTLGPSRADFESFEDAFTVLQDEGVDGAVVIEVQPGTYAERAELGSVPGASDKNTITFLGIDTGGGRPTISATPTSGEPFLIRVEKTPYVTFDNLRFEVANPNQSRGTLLLIEADHLTVQNCTFESIDDNSVTSPATAVIDVRGNDVHILDSEVDEGDVGVWYRETSAGGPASGGRVWRNSFDRNVSGGVFAFNQGAPSGNAISIRDNSVIQNAVDEVGWIGIYLNDHIQGAVLARNRVLPRSGIGIRIEDAAISGSAWISVVNNMVAASAFGIEDGSGIEVVDAERVRVLNNSVLIQDDDGTALSVDAASSGVRLVNNILVHEGTGLLMDVASGALADHDYQVFQATEAPTKMRLRYDGGVYTTLSDYQDDTGAANSIVWPVEFVTPSDLRLDGRSVGDGRLIGQPEPGVPSDIDGDARNATRPYRGADEAATPLADPPPFMSGVYTLGGSEYPTFADAIADLDARGVDGPVTFSVVSRLYTEQITMGPVPGVSSENTITFVGQSGTPPIQFEATNFNFDFVLRLDQAEYVTFRRLAFRSRSDDNADVIEVRGGSDITFDQCVFQADSPDRGVLLGASSTVSSGLGNVERLRVLNSTFDGGVRAINMTAVLSGTTFVETGDHEIIGNTISDLVGSTPTGIQFGGQVSGLIRGNTISMPASGDGFVGIRVGSGSANEPVSSLIVEQNEILAGDGTGIYWERYELGTFPEPGIELRASNNIIRMTGSGPAVGLASLNSADVLFAHNTVSVTSPDPASAAVTVEAIPQVSGANLDLRNNILDAHLGRALVLDLPSLSSRFVHDENAYASNGTALATLTFGTLFDGDCPDLACMVTASTNTFTNEGQDRNSVERQVAFVNAAAGDLRLAASMFGDQDLAGAPLPEVATDIDGDDRSPTRPYRGADEAASTLSFVEFRLRVYLQGAYQGSCGTDCVVLSTALQDGGHLPLSNPYADPAFDGTLAEHDGPEAVTQAQLDAMPPVTDWVVVELRETVDGPAVYRAAHLLSHRGKVLTLGGSEALNLPIPAGDYHVAVYHRNHLPAISTLRALVDESATFTFVRMHRSTDLIGGSSGVAALGPFDLYGLAAADGSGDGLVTAPDFNAYSSAAASGASGYRTEDYTMDGLVTAPDFNVYSANAAAGAATVVPEN